jgi:N-acetylneuraminate synthase
LGIGVSLGAIALGATAIEKHLTLKRSDGGADAAFSMEPDEFSNLVMEGKSVEQALGNSEWLMQPSEAESRRLRRSLYVVQDVSAGDQINLENVRAIRPGGGAPPKLLDQLLGKTFLANYSAGTPVSIEMFSS